MIYFINAKINIGLNITMRREDGYHLLETIFYPIGKFAGTHLNPTAFGDILEVIPGGSTKTPDYENKGIEYTFSGNTVNCPPEKNLVVRAVEKIIGHYGEDAWEKRIGRLILRLEKHIPDGAGMGGGSADATFTLRVMAEKAQEAGLAPLSEEQLHGMALELGADCPFFLLNTPAIGEGIGEILRPVEPFLQGLWAVVVKPEVSISTAEAFRGISPKLPEIRIKQTLKEILENPGQKRLSSILDFRGIKNLRNDFEESLFPNFPILSEIKEKLYFYGADYASLTGSGAALYGIFPTQEKARTAAMKLKNDGLAVWPLLL